MRDPKRIEKILGLLQKGWEKVPDWRFGQVIENFKRWVNVADMFYVEDEEMEELIKEFFQLEEDE